MRIVITGGKGMLGRTLQGILSEHELVVADLPEWDITNAVDFDQRLDACHADAVIHCAAMTAVDKCESEVERLGCVIGCRKSVSSIVHCRIPNGVSTCCCRNEVELNRTLSTDKNAGRFQTCTGSNIVLNCFRVSKTCA